MITASVPHAERYQGAACVILTGMAAHPKRTDPLKPIGFLLLLMGWILVISAVILLKHPGTQSGFVLAGLAVEVLGLVLVARSHVSRGPERN